MLRREFLRLLTGSLIAAPVAARAAIDPAEPNRSYIRLVKEPVWGYTPPRMKWDARKPILLIPHYGVDRAEVEKMFGKYYNVCRTSDARTGFRTEYPLHFYDRTLFTELDYKALRESWEHAMTPWALTIYRQAEEFRVK